MIIQKEFYFVRHGQTDQNIMEGKNRSDFPEDISLNETGRNQAVSIKPIISSLGLHTVCSSPLTIVFLYILSLETMENRSQKNSYNH